MCNFNVKFFSLFGGTAPRPHMLMGYGAHLQNHTINLPPSHHCPTGEILSKVPRRVDYKCGGASRSVWTCSSDPSYLTCSTSVKSHIAEPDSGRWSRGLWQYRACALSSLGLVISDRGSNPGSRHCSIG